MASFRAIAVETAGREVVPSSVARQQSSGRQCHARRSGHECVGLFNASNVLGIIAIRELHQPGSITLRNVSLNGATRLIDGDQNLGTRAARGATHPAEVRKSHPPSRLPERGGRRPPAGRDPRCRQLRPMGRSPAHRPARPSPFRLRRRDDPTASAQTDRYRSGARADQAAICPSRQAGCHRKLRAAPRRHLRHKAYEGRIRPCDAQATVRGPTSKRIVAFEPCHAVAPRQPTNALFIASAPVQRNIKRRPRRDPHVMRPRFGLFGFSRTCSRVSNFRSCRKLSNALSSCSAMTRRTKEASEIRPVRSNFFSVPSETPERLESPSWVRRSSRRRFRSFAARSQEISSADGKTKDTIVSCRP